MTDLKKFVEAWERATSVEEVATKFGITRDSAASKAGTLRAKGVKLKAMRPAFPRVNAPELNALIESIRKEE